MSNLSKLEFGALNFTGKNYMLWVLDVKMHLESMGVAQTIVENNDSPPQDKARANIFLRKHIVDGLKFEYLTIEDPSILWKDLKDRFDNQREVLLPAVREEWRSLRFQDFKKVNEYSSALFRICSQLKLCGQSVTDADMLEKNYSTFHASNMTLQQQYRLQKFTRYSKLNAYLLVVEQDNELLMKNHQSRPTGSLAYPEVNAAKNDPKSFMRGQGQTCFADCHFNEVITQESKARLKRGRPVGSKDKNPRKRKATENAIIHEDIVLEGKQIVAPPEEEIDDINKEISINYGHSKISLDQTETEIIDEKLCYNVAYDIIKGNDDPEPTLAVYLNLDMHLMDVVTGYLYGSLDSDIYMKIPEGFKLPEALGAKPKDMYSVKLQ
uniref:Zinc finger, CCHC-type n=1 Tax=Tanacetum cinerariifolium TaxID=118510 RepID=A0A6L2LE60_TANCI|nr:hypothetical protein [Tanacetum cinerariifolium]